MITLQTLATYKDPRTCACLLEDSKALEQINEMAWKYGSDTFMVEGKQPSGEIRRFLVQLFPTINPELGTLLVQDTVTHEVFRFESKIPSWRKLL